MKTQDTKKTIEEVKKEIELILNRTEENRVLDIIKVLKQPEVKMLISKDNQLLTLNKLYGILLMENKFRCKSFLLNKGKSLDEIEDLYMNMKYYCRRFEYDMPMEYFEESIDYIRKMEVTGIALYNIILMETWKTERNLLLLARYLKADNQLLIATELLQFAVKQYETNSKLIMELADCWLEGQQWEQAYLTLKKIKKPSQEVKEIIAELEEVVCNEKL